MRKVQTYLLVTAPSDRRGVIERAFSSLADSTLELKLYELSGPLVRGFRFSAGTPLEEESYDEGSEANAAGQVKRLCRATGPAIAAEQGELKDAGADFAFWIYLWEESETSRSQMFLDETALRMIVELGATLNLETC